MNASQSEQSARDNEALFRRQIAAWARNDLDELIDCYTEDLIYTEMPYPHSPVRGKAAFRAYMTDYNALFAGGEMEVQVVTLVATSSHVVGELRTQARYVGPGAPEGGVPVSWYATLIDTIADGKIRSEHAYFDPTAFDKAVEDATFLSRP